MKIGVDGNLWYCSNNLCISHKNSIYTFARTLRGAIEKYKEKNPKDKVKLSTVEETYLDLNPEERTNFLKV